MVTAVNLGIASCHDVSLMIFLIFYSAPPDFATFEECSQSQQSLDASQEPETRKKSRKDVKWWQYEGKRRSQRVRGHLMPVSQNATKSERGFAESLKNLIHPSLS